MEAKKMMDKVLGYTQNAAKMEEFDAEARDKDLENKIKTLEDAKKKMDKTLEQLGAGDATEMDVEEKASVQVEFFTALAAVAAAVSALTSVVQTFM